jgi:YD repeat-containing protein
MDGRLYFTEMDIYRVRSVTPVLPGYSALGMIIASEDGSETYFFHSSGRHLETRNGLTDSTTYQFDYDSNGRLSSITDGDGKVTTIERTAGGAPTAIVAPFGQETNLSINADGYLSSISNPADEVMQFTYTEDGLLTTLSDPEGAVYTFTYDDLGLLIKDEDPAGGSQTFVRSESLGVYEVSRTTAENRSTTYRVESLSKDDKRLVNTFSDGTQNVAVKRTDGSREVTFADGTVVTGVLGPDPRFHMQSPFFKSLSVTTPGGRVANLTMERTSTAFRRFTNSA